MFQWLSALTGLQLVEWRDDGRAMYAWMQGDRTASRGTQQWNCKASLVIDSMSKTDIPVLVRPNLDRRLSTFVPILRYRLQRKRQSTMWWMARSIQLVQIRGRRRYCQTGWLPWMLARDDPERGSRFRSMARLTECRQLSLDLFGKGLLVVGSKQRQT